MLYPNSKYAKSDIFKRELVSNLISTLMGTYQVTNTNRGEGFMSVEKHRHKRLYKMRIQNTACESVPSYLTLLG